MKYINKFTIFESSNTIEENIELCKDYIETFNDSDDKFSIFGYRSGYTNSIRKTDFTSRQSHESDDVAILFYLGPKKDGNDEDGNRDYKISSVEDIDVAIEVLSKSRNIFKRLSIYAKKIEIEMINGESRFIISFENINESSKLKKRTDRIYNDIMDSLRDYENSKTISLLDKNTYAVKEDYKNLYQLITKDPSRFNQWKPGERSSFYIRYAVSSSVTDDNKIILKIGQTKWKKGYKALGEYKPFKATNEELEEIAEIAVHKIFSSYHIKDDDRRIVNYDIDKNIIKISFK